jgi:hypothetical protein
MYRGNAIKRMGAVLRHETMTNMSCANNVGINNTNKMGGSSCAVSDKY